MEKVSGPFAITFDSQETPGRMKVLWVEFREEYVPIADLDKREFRLLPQDSPHVAELRKVLS